MGTGFIAKVNKIILPLGEMKLDDLRTKFISMDQN